MKKIKWVMSFVVVFALCLLFTYSADAATQKVTKVTRKSYQVSSSQFYTKYTGYTKSGEKVWTYKTGKYSLTELTVNEMDQTKAIVKNSLVYIATPDNRIIALKKNTGKVKWKTAKNTIGSLTDYCFDSAGNMYICGYYGPDAVKISKKGKVCWKVDTVDSKRYWAYKVRMKNGKVAITFDAPKKKTLYLSKKTGKLVK